MCGDHQYRSVDGLPRSLARPSMGATGRVIGAVRIVAADDGHTTRRFAFDAVVLGGSTDPFPFAMPIASRMASSAIRSRSRNRLARRSSARQPRTSAKGLSLLGRPHSDLDTGRFEEQAVYDVVPLAEEFVQEVGDWLEFGITDRSDRLSAGRCYRREARLASSSSRVPACW